MKPLYPLFLLLIIAQVITAQSHQCTILSDVCCAGEESEDFVMLPIEQTSALRSNEAAIYINQVPLVHYNGVIDLYPLELRIVTDQSINSVSIEYFDYVDYVFKESVLLDDGSSFDEAAADGIYTSIDEILKSRNLGFNESIKQYNLLFGTITVTFANGNTEDFEVKHDACTIDGDAIQLDTSLEIKNVGLFSYSENVAVYVQDQVYSRNFLNYPYEDIQEEFENIWTDFDDPIIVFSTFTETNDGDIRFRTVASPPGNYILNTSNTGMTTAFPLNHEINHFWMYPGRFAITPNHLRYIELPQSGFGYSCYNGVFTEIYEENGQVKYKVEEADNPHDYYYNNMELNLMGVLPIDSVSFPIKYYTAPSYSACNSFAKTLSGGSIDYISKEFYIDYVASRNLPDVSDGLALKFVFLSDRQLTKEEHALLEYLVLNYEDVFESSTKDLVDLQPELYPITTTSATNLEENAMEVLVHPNPTDGQVALTLNSLQQTQLSIYDITGKLCTSTFLQNGRNTIDVSYLPSGLYVMRFLLDDKTHHTQRLVKH